MRRGISDPPSSPLRQIDALARAVFPAGFLVFLMIMASVPMGLPGLVPAVTLPCVFFWSVFRPTGMPPPTTFCIGLMQDLLTQAPLGASVLPLLLCQGVALRWRGFLARASFLLIWLIYFALAAGAAMLAWALHSVLGWRLLPVAPTVYGVVLTAGLYPILSYLLAKVHQGMRRAEGAV
jgi:rod shape-determining protein MreD